MSAYKSSRILTKLCVLQINSLSGDSCRFAYWSNAANPRFLTIAGDQVSPREIKEVVCEVTGEKFRLFRAGGRRLLSFIIKIARKVAPGENELYPAWQGMQYMCNMIDERSITDMLDNNRYPEMAWTTVREVII